MSSSGDGGKPAQLGLVDMGDHPASTTTQPCYPALLHIVRPHELHGLVQRDGAERRLAATAAHAGRRARHRSSIDSAIAAVTAYNASTAPASASSSGCGAAIRRPSGPRTSTGRRSRSPARRRSIRTVYDAQTIGRFWTADYVDAWSGLQNAARQPLRQQSPDPRHFPDGRRLGHRRTVRVRSTPRLRCRLDPTAPDGEPGQPGAGRRATPTPPRCSRCAPRSPTMPSGRTTPLDFTLNPFHLFDSLPATRQPSTPTSRSPSCSRRATPPAWSRPAITP